MSDTVKVRVIEETALTMFVTDVVGRAGAYQEVPRGLYDAYVAAQGAADEAEDELLDYLRDVPVVNPMDEYERG